ncbi:MAG: hypothetical protein WC055_00895 [Melioribacteraceae bacterium]
MSIIHKNCRIAYGTTRVVFLIGKYAFKIPSIMYEFRLFLLGLLANMQEVQFSKINQPELCPVLFYIPFGFLVVMPRCEPLTREEFFEMDAENWLLREDYTIPAEPKLDSFGKYKGKIVAVDYGN